MTAVRKALILVFFVSLAVPFDAAKAATAFSSATEGLVTADELLDVFVAMKASTVVMQLIAQHEDPSFYSRAWIEDAIRSALEASKEPEAPGLNWVEDSLMAKLSAGIGVERVYGIALVDAGSGMGSLAMQVTDTCHRPSTLTIAYILEGGAWRVSHVSSNSTKAARAWFHDGLKPTREFAHVQPRDRSRYLNESILGKALGLDVKNHECTASR